MLKAKAASDVQGEVEFEKKILQVKIKHRSLGTNK